MRGRGSKQIAVALFDVGVDVAPHAGAWIETAISATKGRRRMSPLMRGRQPRSGGSAYQVVLERMCVIRTAARIPLVRRVMRKYIRGIYFQEASRYRSIPQMG